jgi:hypothetical protein
MSIKILYLRKETSSTLLVFSAIALLLSSPVLLLSNPLLQLARAQTPNVRTTKPAVSQDGSLVLTYEAIATANSSYAKGYAVNGKFEITNPNNGSIAYSSNIQGGGGFGYEDLWFSLASQYRNQSAETFSIEASCDTSDSNNDIYFYLGTASSEIIQITFQGPVECPPPLTQGGGNITTTQSMAAGRSQDSDGDGIPDSSDRCTHNSNPKCFKEDTTTQQQQPSSNGSRNQTR